MSSCVTRLEHAKGVSGDMYLKALAFLFQEKEMR